jgi:hypothetical protein
MKTTVAVKVWGMGSDPGYRPSSGKQEIRLVPIKKIQGAACEDNEALYHIARDFSAVPWGEFNEQEPLRWQSGALTYTGVTGSYEVPEGYVAVQTTYEDICTNNEVFYGAKMLNEKSLLTMYRERAQRYAELVTELEACA